MLLLFFFSSFWFAKPRALNEVCLQLFSMATDHRNHIYLFFSCQFRHENADVIKPTTHCAHRDYVIFCQSFVERTQWTKQIKQYVNESGNRCACGFVNSIVHFYCLLIFFFLFFFCLNVVVVVVVFIQFHCENSAFFFLSIDETNALRINSEGVQCFNATNTVASVYRPRS